VEQLMLVVGWVTAIFVAALELIILWLMITGKIDLRELVSEKAGGAASLSRFQFLVFTFTIATSLVFITFAQSPPKFPDVPPGVFALLGISGGSYVISKGIQANQDEPNTRDTTK